jgi:hypothetical protein
VVGDGCCASLRELGLVWMSELTKDEALVFVESMRLTLVNRVGFRWMVEKLSDLAAYIESVNAENARLNAYLDWAKARGDYESCCVAYPDVHARGDARDEG